jgi:capsule biosynthesis phosphatase
MNFKTFIIDIDDTLCKSPRTPQGNADYSNAQPIQRVVDKINQLYLQGHQIIFFTARGMRTFNGDVAKVQAVHEPILIQWLAKHHISYHKLIFGKPWYKDYFFIDDRSVTVDQFVNQNVENFETLLKHNNPTLYE